MITKFKKFETINQMYKKGDYAITTFFVGGTFQHVIVQIKEIRNDTLFLVRKLDDNTKNYLLNPYQIEFWSENKEELEMYLDSKKYNL